VTVLPIVAAVVAIAGTLQSDTALHVVGDVVRVTLTTTIHIVFWTTLVFAIIERTPNLKWSPIRPWTPDELPEPRTRRTSTAELVGETVMAGLFITLILLTPVLKFQTEPDGTAINVLSPWLWDTGFVYVFVALVAGGLAMAFVKHYVRWNPSVAIAAGLISLATASALIWIAASQRVVNPAFAEATGWPAVVPEWIHKGVIVGGAIAILVTAVQTVAGFVTRSWNPADLGSLIGAAVERLPGPPRR
jgi:hypothetical protein